MAGIVSVTRQRGRERNVTAVPAKALPRQEIGILGLPETNGDLRVRQTYFPETHPSVVPGTAPTPGALGIAAPPAQRAEERLKSDDTSIEDIAQACGFANARALTERFRAHHGLTPFAFRKQARAAAHRSRDLGTP